MKTYIAIIGAGSAGISAMRQVSKETDDFVLIDRGPLGTTCARTGCMPSKALIHVAREFHSRTQFEKTGIRGADQLECDLPAVMRHVRKLRDRFAGGMVDTTRKSAGDHLIEGEARLLSPNVIEVNGKRIEADRIIIATGSSPLVPKTWETFGNRILTSETIFEQETLPKRIAVVGLGPIGLELGQAFARLGVEISGFNLEENIGGLTDPKVNTALRRVIQADFPLHIGAAEVDEFEAALRVRTPDTQMQVDSVIAAMGTVPNLQLLNAETLGMETDERGIPLFNPETGQVADLPIYIAGDVNGYRPLLHEALDEGFMAGNNILLDAAICTARRVPLRIVFSDPEAMVVGKSFKQLENTQIAIGTIDYAKQSRALIEGRNEGLLRLYAAPANGLLLGAEAVAPGATDLGHLLAFAIQKEATVFDLLRMPFYHPTLTEGLRTALRDAARQCRGDETSAIRLHECSPERPLS